MEVVSIVNSHRSGKTNQDVEMIKFSNGTMLFLPNGIGNFFTNLKSMIVGHSNSSFLGTKLIKRSNFKDLRKLKELAFYRNDIEVIDKDSLWDLSNLENFKLVYNKLKFLHESTFEKNLKLKKVSMHSNELNFIPWNLFKNNLLLEYVDFTHNSLQTIDEKTFQTNERLKEVYLASNQLKILSTNLFSNNLLLEAVSVNENFLKTVEEKAFQNNVKLMSLNLASNQLEFLPRNLFQNNPSLYWVNFRNNSLKSIEIDFAQHKHFHQIIFYNNTCIDATYGIHEIEFINVTRNLTEFQNLIKANCQ